MKIKLEITAELTCDEFQVTNIPHLKRRGREIFKEAGIQTKVIKSDCWTQQ